MRTRMAMAAAALGIGALAGMAGAQQDPRGRGADGAGSVTISGELKQWHRVTLALDGPFARERDRDPNPFTDYRMTVTFRHESGTPEYRVPGYFAADGNAAETSAEAGTRWMAHLSPDRTGRWTYRVSFARGKHAALFPEAPAQALPRYEGKSGSFQVGPTDKKGRDLRAKGRLQYVGRHHLRFAGSGEYFLKAGPDSPETLLAAVDFDGTQALKPNVPLKTWQPHLRDWRPGDPSWKGGRGRGLIGALNYLSGKGCNAFSFLTYNAGGDGDNVWPFVARDEKLHYDCSRLAQWQIVFDHAQALGLYLHFKMQEQENDDNRQGGMAEVKPTPVSLDNGDLGPERRLYCRELIARFGHSLALNWNLGEENTQSTEQQVAMARYILDTDPYDHLIVVHTFPNWQDRVYTPLLGRDKPFTGASLQQAWHAAHARTLKWVTESAAAGRPWVVANDEQGSAATGVPPDPGYQGFDGTVRRENEVYDLHDIRKASLWGTLMAGGAGVEYYFGYQLPENDLVCQDFRSRDRSWDYCRYALDFFRDNRVPFWEMKNANALIGSDGGSRSGWCLARAGDLYLVYLPAGGTARLDLSGGSGAYSVRWFNPRAGGALRQGSVAGVRAPGSAALGMPPADPAEDWLVVVRKT